MNIIKYWKEYKKGYSQLNYKCLNCGHTFTGENNFCPNCGIKLYYESVSKRIITPSGYFYATEPTMPKIYKWNKGKYTLLQWAKMEKNYNLFVW